MHISRRLLGVAICLIDAIAKMA